MAFVLREKRWTGRRLMKRKKLVAARQKKGWNQQALADHLDPAVSRTTVSYWECAWATPHPHYKYELCRVLGFDDPEVLLAIDYTGDNNHESQDVLKEAINVVDGGMDSASSEEESRESMTVTSEASRIHAADSNEALLAPSPPTQVPITSSWQFPKESRLHHFIASDMTRSFWQIAHTDYTTSDEMMNAVRSATEDFDMMNMGNPSYKITRRDAMCELASVPLIALGSQQTLHAKRYEEMLRYCATALEACWELYRGNDPVGTQHAFQCVCTYVPILETIAKDSAQHQKRALDLATRYGLLKTHLGRHCAKAAETISYGQEAVDLSNETGDIFLQLSAYTKLGWAYFYDRKYAQAYNTMLKGENVLKDYQRMKNMPPLPSCVIGNFYSGYSLVQANNGISPDTALGIATNSEPDQTHMAFMEFTLSSQLLEAAETCCSKGDSTQAMIWLAKRIDLETLAPRSNVPQSEQGRMGAINVMTRSLLQSEERDMGRIIHVWKVAMQGAKALKSEVRYQDALTNFEVMRILWPREDRIMKLVPLTAHW